MSTPGDQKKVGRVVGVEPGVEEEEGVASRREERHFK